jgi:hypothetical protein
MAAGIVVAERNQVMNPAHVAKRHRRAGWVLIR